MDLILEVYAKFIVEGNVTGCNWKRCKGYCELDSCRNLTQSNGYEKIPWHYIKDDSMKCPVAKSLVLGASMLVIVNEIDE